MFSVKPVFVGWITLLYQLPFQIFFTVWSAAFFGGLTSSFHILPQDSWFPFIFFGGAAFVGIPLGAYFGKKLNYARTEYKFLEDRLEFEAGFFTINEKVIRFKDVTEVTLRKSLFQRIYGLGSIYLATQAIGSFARNSILGFGNISASGVWVRDIRNPDETFKKIRDIVDSQNT